MTNTPTSIDDLRNIGLSERDALIAAAVLPHLPDGDVLVRVRDDDMPDPISSDPDEMRRFKHRTDPDFASTNLRRMRIVDEDPKKSVEVSDELIFEPRPHGIASYRLSLYDVDVLFPADDADAYDFDDTDQAALSDFGVSSSVVEYVHVGIGTPAESPYDRKPVFPV